MNYPRVPGGQVGQLVRAPKTSELIAAQLRRQIVRGTVIPGQKLPPETQLMEQFGVSRPTIREAFRILETERLIIVRPGSRGGAQVVAPDLTVAARYVGLLLQLQGATIDDVYEARKIAEPACAACSPAAGPSRTSPTWPPWSPRSRPRSKTRTARCPTRPSGRSLATASTS